jgi:hypothetical protein
MSQNISAWNILLVFLRLSHLSIAKPIATVIHHHHQILIHLHYHTPTPYSTSANMCKPKYSHTTTEPKATMATEGLPALQANHDLWYKIHVLLYDLRNIATDRTAESRTLATTDELYISVPYFTTDEAVLITQTRIPPPTLQEIPEFELLGYDGPVEEAPVIEKDVSLVSLVTVEDAIKGCLENFFEKRRASGDARPCGPHDMGPIYLAVFGISKAELKDEAFLSRLRRAGLPRMDAEGTGKNDGRNTQKGGKKGGNKGARKA